MGRGAAYVPPDIPFTSNESIKASIPATSQPLEYFKLYLTDDILDHIVTETN